MRYLITFILFFGSFEIYALTAQPQQLKAFRDWKNEKIQQIQTRIAADRVQIELIKSKKQSEINSLKVGEAKLKLDINSDSLIQHYEKEIAQEQWNLEVALDLSITDYIVLYLAAQPVKDKFQVVAGQLSQGEVAQLMEAYTQSLGIKAPAAISAGVAGSASASPASIRAASGQH